MWIMLRVCLAMSSGIFLTSCTRQSITPVGNGFELVTVWHTSFLGEPENAELKLEYKEPHGRGVSVWPRAGWVVCVRSNHVVFQGDRSVRWIEHDKVWDIEARIFVWQPQSLPVDITSEVLHRWAQDAGKDVSTAVNHARVKSLKEAGDILQVHFEFDGGEFGGADGFPNVDVMLKWDQIESIAEKVRKDGAVRKDPELGLNYVM